MTAKQLTFVLLIGLTVCNGNGTADESSPQAVVQSILAKAIKASGGEAKLARLHTVGWKTKAVNYLDESMAQGFDQYRAEIDVVENGKASHAVLVVNREKAWMKLGGKTIDAADKDYLDPRREIFYLIRLPELLLPLRNKDYTLTPAGELKIGDRPAVGILVEHKKHTNVTLFFDKESGLVVKSEARMTIPTGQTHQFEIFFSNHQDIDGLKHFTKIAVDVDRNRFLELELSELKPQDKLDDDFFAKP